MQAASQGHMNTWGGGLQYARMVKTPRKLDHLRQAATTADQAQFEAHTQVYVKITEQDLYRIIVNCALAHGGGDVIMVQVATGERSSYSNRSPSTRPHRWGDVVKIDVFVSSHEYLSDTGRAIMIGEATREHCNIWSYMEETLAEVGDIIRPGVHTWEPWEIFIKRFAMHGIALATRSLGPGL